MRKKILIVDDEKNMRWAIRKALEKEAYDIFEAANGQEGVQKCQALHPDLILLDLKMPVMDGMQALEKIKEYDPQIPVMMLTAHGTMESAVEAMKLGALDYLSKPFDIEELKLQIRKALHVGELEVQVSYLREELEQKSGKMIVGKSPGMQAVFQMVKQVADTTATVLILGESGTGKELIANAIHHNSSRRDLPFVKVNCGAIPANLIESELFGHEKGAFTGASFRKIGKFERARNGTILLDEIAELDPAMQVKLLRVLQEKEIERVGGNEVIPVDVRIIAATNRDLLQMTESGDFREDLYYRLNVIPIKVPPLRERKEDIPVLTAHFLNHFAKETGKKELSLSDQAVRKLVNHPWKGNIRELENLIERLVIMSTGPHITVTDIPIDSTVAGMDKNRFTLPAEGISLEEMEKNLLMQALERTEYNQTQAAKLLGLTRHTLLYRMEKYQIDKK